MRRARTVLSTVVIHPYVPFARAREVHRITADPKIHPEVALKEICALRYCLKGEPSFQLPSIRPPLPVSLCVLYAAAALLFLQKPGLLFEALRHGIDTLLTDIDTVRRIAHSVPYRVSCRIAFLYADIREESIRDSL